MENVKTAIRPALHEQTRVVIEDVREYVERGLDVMRELIRQEQSQLETQTYLRLVGTQRLFEAVGCYLRSVNADLASADKDGSTTEPS
jgi:sporulation-control protein spo0M